MFLAIPPSKSLHWKPKVLLQELSWPKVAAVAGDLPVVIPIAALEQHGRHMPVFTDSMLLDEVVRLARGSLGDRVVWTPLLWLGNSHHHIDFAGTLSAAPRTYLDLLADLLDNLVTHGFRRIILLNGHGGNITPAGQAIFEVRDATAIEPTCSSSRRRTGSWAPTRKIPSPRSCKTRWVTLASGKPQ